MLKDKLLPHQKAGIAKLKARLKKKLIDPIVEAKKVKIKEIIVKQSLNLYGEYSENEFVDVKTNSGVLKIATLRSIETNNALIKRIYLQIKALAEYAKKEHLASLPKDPENNNEDSRYYITRITTNEFFFYPQKKRGPIPVDDFQSLLKAIEALAESLPENLHLALATFPIYVPGIEATNNVSVYVQCGPIPTINVSAKAIITNVDCQYPGKPTLRIFCNKEELRSYLFKEIKLKNDKISPILQSHPALKNNLQLFKDIKMLCEMTPELRAKGDLLKNLKTIIDCLMQDKSDDKLLDKALSQYFYSIKQHLTNLEKGSGLKINSNDTFVSRPMYSFHSSNAYKLFKGIDLDNMTYGGIIPIQCFRAQFNTVFEICVDHAADVGLKMFMQKNVNAEKTLSEAQNKFISQLVSSNRIGVKEINSLTKTIIAADSLKPGMIHFVSSKKEKVEPDEKFEAIACEFGREMDLIIYPFANVDIVKDGLEEIFTFNDFLLEINALRLYRTNRPDEADVITQCIHEEMLNHLVAELEEITPYSSNNIISIMNTSLLMKLKIFRKTIGSWDEVIALLEENMKSAINFWGDAFARVFHKILDTHHARFQYEQSELAAFLKDPVPQRSTKIGQNKSQFWSTHSSVTLCKIASSPSNAITPWVPPNKKC